MNSECTFEQKILENMYKLKKNFKYEAKISKIFFYELTFSSGPKNEHMNTHPTASFLF